MKNLAPTKDNMQLRIAELESALAELLAAVTSKGAADTRDPIAWSGSPVQKSAIITMNAEDILNKHLTQIEARESRTRTAGDDGAVATGSAFYSELARGIKMEIDQWAEKWINPLDYKDDLTGLIVKSMGHEIEKQRLENATMREGIETALRRLRNTDTTWAVEAATGILKSAMPNGRGSGTTRHPR